MRVVQERRPVRPPVTSPATGAASSRRLLVVPVLAAVVVVADQASKTWALHHTLGGRHVLWTVWFDLTFNSGAAFGIGNGITPLVEVAVLVVIGVFFVFGRRAARSASWPTVISLGLVTGGAAGNLADRFFRHIPGHPGAVIDFVAAARVGQHDWWPVFNVADSCIVVGVIVLVLSIRRHPSTRRPDPAGRSEDPAPRMGEPAPRMGETADG